MVAAEPILANLIGQIRAASRDQLILFAKVPAVSIEPFDLENLPFVQQMTHILVTSSGLEISFKTHFMIRDASALTGNKLQATDISVVQAIDFMKEFCNIVAGKTKAMIEAAGLTAAQSLPIAIQGYNEIFYPSLDASFAHDAWQLTSGTTSICCSIHAALRSKDQLPSLAKVVYKEESTQEIGVVELF